MAVTISTGDMLTELAGLRVPCPEPWANRYPKLRIAHSQRCGTCDGTGEVVQFPMLQEESLEAVWAAARSMGWHPQFYYAQGPPPEDSVNRGFFHQEKGAVMSQEREDFAGFVEAMYKVVRV